MVSSRAAAPPAGEVLQRFEQAARDACDLRVVEPPLVAHQLRQRRPVREFLHMRSVPIVHERSL